MRNVLLSNKVNYWTGNEGKSFEKEFAEWCGTDYAIAVANGTVALEAALKAIDIKEGDEVIVPSRTFVATASSVSNMSAKPVFADIDLISGNISADTIEPLLTPKTKAIICVHLAGWPCDMDPIRQLAEKHNLFIIEDCAQAHGATYKSQSVGSLGDIAAWSFCQDKIMTTGGEGGMVTTNNEDLWKKLWAYKDHGKNYDTVYHKDHPPGFRWLHESFGTNIRMTEMQSAIGRIQLKRMPNWLKARQKNAEAIRTTCQQYAHILDAPYPNETCQHACYKYYVYVKPENLPHGWDRDKIMTAITDRGIPCFSGSCSEVYLEKAFKTAGQSPKERLPNARTLGETSLMFLVHPTITSEEIHHTCRTIEEVLSEFCTKAA